jgi:hypothetical protein
MRCSGVTATRNDQEQAFMRYRVRYNSQMGASMIKYTRIICLVLVLSACGSSSSVSSGYNWSRQAENPLIVPTITATTLDYGPADPSVLFDTDDNKWKAWFSSTLKDIATSNETMTIKYSESLDGISWSTPQIAFQVSSDPTAWDYTNAETPSVIKNSNPSAPASEKFMLWYSGANTTLATSEGRPTTFPYYQIGLAYSADGKSFTRVSPGLNSKPGLVLVPDAALFGSSLPGTFGDGLVADPDVIYRNNQFQIWFSSYAETSARSPLAFGISYATSTDGVTWSAPQDNPLSTLAKPGEVAAGQQPSVLFNPATSKYEMWFSNDTDAEKTTIPCSFNTVHGFWHAVSGDGVNWTPDYSRRDLTYDTQYAYESLGLLTGVKVVLDNGTFRAYYTAWGTDQIPDTSAYFCPDQHGGLISAVLTLNRATLVSR